MDPDAAIPFARRLLLSNMSDPGRQRALWKFFSFSCTPFKFVLRHPWLKGMAMAITPRNVGSTATGVSCPSSMVKDWKWVSLFDWGVVLTRGIHMDILLVSIVHANFFSLPSCTREVGNELHQWSFLKLSQCYIFNRSDQVQLNDQFIEFATLCADIIGLELRYRDHTQNRCLRGWGRSDSGRKSALIGRTLFIRTLYCKMQRKEPSRFTYRLDTTPVRPRPRATSELGRSETTRVFIVTSHPNWQPLGTLRPIADYLPPVTAQEFRTLFSTYLI